MTLLDILSNVRFLLVTSLVLHWFLVLIHVGLRLLQLHPLRPFNVDSLGFKTIDALSVAITAGPTALFKVYSIVLIALTQRLAFNKRVHRNGTLAAFCDESTAWHDVGPAAKTLWKQTTVCTAPFTILVILVYLGSIVGLGLTTPAMVQVAQVTLNASMYTDSPQLLSYVTPQDVRDAFTAVSLLDLSEYGLLNIPGLEWNTIFDVVQVGGYETTRAQAVWFDVDCHNIDGLEQSHPGQYVIQNNTIQYAFHVDDSLEDIYIAPANSSVNIVTAKPKNTQSPSPLTLFVASTVPIDDGTLGLVASVQYSPPINITLLPLPLPDSSPKPFNDSSLYIVACDILVTNGTVPVTSNGNSESLQNGLSFFGTGELPSEFLLPWNSTSAPKSPGLLSGLEDFSSLAPPSGNLKSTQLRDANVSASFMPTLLEEAVTHLLYFTPEYHPAMILPSDLADALNTVLAMIYWRAQVGVRLKGSDPGVFGGIDVLGLQIQINKYMPTAGLVLSIIAAISSMALSMQKRSERVVERPNLVQTLILLTDEQMTDLAEKANQHEGLNQSEALLAAGKGIVLYVKDGRILAKGEAVGKSSPADSIGRPTIKARLRRLGNIRRQPSSADNASEQTLLP
ncbi:hypothetical protein NM688_g4962 [Phlebia brevispora]|uniref:Uncharacterized protein n=1 Tax=Phlebia brevispora TaxID=194682 RepID=A0ACC1T1F1_9APHY|nr:hypothetical protein NM688_g4962 [Phlebia brevispora]